MSVNFINRIIDKIKINLFNEDFIVTRKNKSKFSNFLFHMKLSYGDQIQY